jgi:hypothetical protein
MASKVSTLVNCSDIDEVECLNDFVESIQNEMSVNGAIPFTIPAESIAQLAKNAKTMFYKMYEDATEEMFIAIPESEIRKRSFQRGIHTMDSPGDNKVTAKFKKGEGKEPNTGHTRGTYVLPDGVISVVGVYSLGGWSGEAGWNTGLLGKNSGDVSLHRMVYQSVYDRTMAVSADNTMYYICTEAFLDMSRQIFQNMISFKYNRLTNNLRFLGELPKSDVILDVLVRVPDCDLYNDDLFRRYVIADCKVQLSRILGAFNYQMPGNISVNVEAIANEGSAEKEQIIQELKDMSGAWYILTT